MNVAKIKVDCVNEGDIVQMTPDAVHRSLVVDIRENARMDGVWLEFADYSSRFFNYDDTVYLVTFNES